MTEEQTPFPVGRVASAGNNIYIIMTPDGPLSAEASGRLLFSVADPADLPTVGDEVAYLPVDGETRAVIQEVMPRRTEMARRAAGEKSRRQVLAANVDTAFITVGLDRPLNIRTVERYVVLAGSGAVEPRLLLSKADLHPDPDGAAAEASAALQGVCVDAVSCLTGRGLADLASLLVKGRTFVFVGPSGAGKSSLINRLTGREAAAVGDVRAGDGKGRHTTTSRRMLPLPGGAFLIDTPGLRELGLAGDDGGLEAGFPEIETLAAECRFRDCTHRREKGCAVRAAAEAGTISPERLQHYLKLRKEMESRDRRTDPRLRKADGKRMGRMVKEVKNLKKKNKMY